MLVYALKGVAESNHDGSVLEQITQWRCRRVARISKDGKLVDRAIEEGEDNLVVALFVIGATGPDWTAKVWHIATALVGASVARQTDPEKAVRALVGVKRQRR